MMRALWGKAISEARWLLLACSSVVFLFSWMRIWLTGQVDMRRFQQIIDAIPEGLATLSPVPIQQLASYPVRIAVTFEEPILFIAMTVWAISRSSDSVSGEIGRGTMEILAAQPTRRTTLLAIQAAVTTMGVAVLAITAWAGIAVGIAMFSAVQSADPLQLKIPLLGWHIPLGGVTGDPAPIPMRLLVDAEIFWPAVLNYFAFGFFLAGCGTLLSSCDRYRWRTIGLMVGFYVVELLLELAYAAADKLDWLKPFTFFSAYEPTWMISQWMTDERSVYALLHYDVGGQLVGLGSMGCQVMLISLGLLAYGASFVVFARRDLPAPL